MCLSFPTPTPTTDEFGPAAPGGIGCSLVEVITSTGRGGADHRCSVTDPFRDITFHDEKPTSGKYGDAATA
jgi:hypothetical protein